MSMTKSRRSVYNKSWYKRECKFDMKRRKREYNRKIRHQNYQRIPVPEDTIRNFVI